MASLKPDVKLFIVQCLACFDTPTQVKDKVKQEFGIEVGLQKLSAYNPDTVAGSRMSQKLKAVFEETRNAYTESIKGIAIANQAFRLHALQRMFERVEKQGNVVIGAQLLEQAAKEVGEAFTNKSKLEHGGEGGGPLTVVVKKYGDA
jgi:hypothetical protein